VIWYNKLKTCFIHNAPSKYVTQSGCPATCKATAVPKFSSVGSFSRKVSIHTHALRHYGTMLVCSLET